MTPWKNRHHHAPQTIRPHRCHVPLRGDSGCNGAEVPSASRSSSLSCYVRRNFNWPSLLVHHIEISCTGEEMRPLLICSSLHQNLTQWPSPARPAQIMQTKVGLSRKAAPAQVKARMPKKQIHAASQALQDGPALLFKEGQFMWLIVFRKTSACLDGHQYRVAEVPHNASMERGFVGGHPGTGVPSEHCVGTTSQGFKPWTLTCPG